MSDLLIGTDHEVQVTALKDEDGNLLTAATVQMTLYTFGTTTQVSGVSWPVTLTHEGSGNYAGILPSTVSLTKSEKYDLEVTAEQSGKKRTWRRTVRAVYGAF